MTKYLNDKLNELQTKHENLKVNFEIFTEHNKKPVLGLFMYLNISKVI